MIDTPLVDAGFPPPTGGFPVGGFGGFPEGGFGGFPEGGFGGFPEGGLGGNGGATPVPQPGSLLLTIAGLALAAWGAWRSRR